MSEVVNLPIALDSDLGREFVEMCARYDEGLVTEAAVKKKYRFDEATWERLGENEALIEAIDKEKTRRVRDGSAKRERAQQLVVKAPDVLGGIMLDDRASPRHRVDAIKTLDTFAANGPERAPAADRFIITIHLGETSETYSKSIAIDSNDVAPNDVVPEDIDPNVIEFAAIAATKKKGRQ